jgi:hypothetical protein
MCRWAELMSGMTTFNWDPLEKLLNDVASRGHQTVFRVWMVYPGKDKGIPDFLIKEGLKVTTWLNDNTAPSPPQNVHTPDYDDPRLREALKNFIAAMGEKYDGDPRLGFITAGLLGTWGEWHEYPRVDLFASKETQAEVLDAYSAAFRITPVLLRYPAGDDNRKYTKNADRPFGYHDDSFAWATLDTGREGRRLVLHAVTESGRPGSNAEVDRHIPSEEKSARNSGAKSSKTTYPTDRLRILSNAFRKRMHHG